MPNQGPEPNDSSTPRSPRRATPFGKIALIVAAYAAAVYLPFLGSSRTLTGHEVDIAQPAQVMVDTGDWLVPMYEGRPWVHKGVLVVWMAAPLFAMTGGFSEYATRLPAALSAVAICLVVAALARRFYGTRAALYAGLVQATCVYMYTQGRLGECDMTLALLVAGAHYVLARCWGEGRTDLPLRWAALFHTLLGLSVLAKGPMSPALVGATILAFCIVRRSVRPLISVVATPAILCFFAVGLSWFVAVTLRLGDSVTGQLNHSYIDRLLGGYHMGARPFPYYLWTIPWLMLPWSVALILGARQLIERARQSDAFFERFCWCWFFGGLIFLSLSVFKHKHYCFPILPPLSVFCGKILADHASSLGKRATPVYAGVFAVLLVAFGIVGGVIMPARDHRQVRVDFVREATADIPADAHLFLVGLTQSSFYPYLEHPSAFCNTWSEMKSELRDRAGESLWVLTPRKNLPPPESHGVVFDEEAAEAVREKYPRPKTLVLGRIEMAPASFTPPPVSPSGADTD